MIISEEIADLNFIYFLLAKRIADTEDVDSCRGESIEYRTGLNYKFLQSLKKITIVDIKEMKSKMSGAVFFMPRLSSKDINNILLVEDNPLNARTTVLLRLINESDSRTIKNRV